MLTAADKIEAARGFIEDGDDIRAESLLKSAADALGPTGDTETLLGMIAVKRHRLDAAQQHLTNAVRLEPANVQALQNLAHVLRAQGRRTPARELTRRILAIDPDHTPARVEHACDLALDGDRLAALRELQTIKTDDPVAHDAHLLAGSILGGDGDVAAGIGHFRMALAHDPGSPLALVKLADALAIAGDRGEALRTAEKAYLRDPANLLVIQVLAERQLGAGAVRECLETLQPVLEGNSLNLDLQRLHAEALIALGKTEEAVSRITAYVKGLPADRRGSAETISALAHLLNQAGRHGHGLAISRSVRQGETASALEKECLMLLGRFDEVWPESGGETFPEPGDPFIITVPPETEPQTLIVTARYFTRFPKARFVAEKRFRDILEALGGHFVEDDAEAILAALADLEPEKRNGVGNAEPYTVPSIGLEDCPVCARAEPRHSPEAIPYLIADPEHVARFRAALPETDKKRIGVIWSPHAPSLSLEFFKTHVFSEMDAVPVSLMWGEARRQLKDWPDALDAGPYLKSIADILACVSALDAVTGVDSVPLHLAAAAGVTTVALATDQAKWVWAHENGESFWYPGATVIPCPIIFPDGKARNAAVGAIRGTLGL